MTEEYTEHDAFKEAVYIAAKSGCDKSHRGAVAFSRLGYYASATNGPPKDFPCTGASSCSPLCSDLAVHAEERAMMLFLECYGDTKASLGIVVPEVELLHVKVASDGEPVYSGPPSCLRCSAKLLDFGFKGIWLYHPHGLHFYPAKVFHGQTLKYFGKDTYRKSSLIADTRIDWAKLYNDSDLPLTEY